MRVFLGNQMGIAGYVFELLWDEWKDKTWDQLGEYVRAHPKIGNATCHVKCHGGPTKSAWFYPKKTIAASQGPGKGVPTEDFEARLRKEKRIWELEQKLKEYQHDGLLKKSLKEMLADGVDVGSKVLIEELLSREVTLDDDDDEEEEEVSWWDHFQAGLNEFREAQPELYEGVKIFGLHFLAEQF